MRWITGVGALALALAMVAGCKQQCFIHECDYDHYRELMPAWLECQPASILPTEVAPSPPPATIFDPDRPPRYISLAECIAIALERGNTGENNPNSLLSLPALRFAGGTVNGSDNIRVLALAPARAGAAIDLALSKFDAQWITSMVWNNVDRPVGTPLDTFQAGATGVGAIEQQEASLATGLVKPLPTGGLAGITFTTDYQLTNLPARVNPSYRPALQFALEQPLLQFFGTEINQLLPFHPGLRNLPLRFNQRLLTVEDGILVARLRFDQERAEFERRIQTMLLNVESAYWTLYGAYWTLFAQEQGLRFAYEAWKITYEQFKVGRKSETELAQARAQYELFRSQRLAALGTGGGGGGVQPLQVAQQPGVLEAERQLRNLLNLPIEDGTRLVPCDAPTLAPYRPDWHTALNQALALRPELIMARQELKTRQLNLILQRNFLLPDLRGFATYDINAIGNRLDGPMLDNAFRNLASNHFNNWQLGLSLEMPLGFRAAHTNVRRAKLELAQAYNSLKEQELRTERALAVPYRLLFELHEQIQMARSQREATAQQLRGRFEEVRAGRGTLDILLEAQRLWANALSTEFNFIVQYNIALANFEFSKGTILQHNNVYIAEGPLPHCAQVRAVEHERERTKALVLKERSNPVFFQPCCPECTDCPVPILPQLPPDAAPSLPALMEKAPRLPAEVPEQLQMPRSAGPSNSTPRVPPPPPATETRPAPAPSLPPSKTSGIGRNTDSPMSLPLSPRRDGD
ncbi:MAG TPA: TolC family protein [Gemmataceae bacterium]|nr:TolC family protein [Gemmataceae bacterium]